MNNLLFFFAIPVATIILSIILETLIKCPYKVCGIFFSVFLVVLIGFFSSSAEYILAAMIYSIISFVFAYITMIVQNNIENRRRENLENSNCCNRRIRF